MKSGSSLTYLLYNMGGSVLWGCTGFDGDVEAG